MEFEMCRAWHLPFAKGRIENGLAPAPKKVIRPFRERWSEALSVLRGDSIAIKCYDDIPCTHKDGYK